MKKMSKREFEFYKKYVGAVGAKPTREAPSRTKTMVEWIEEHWHEPIRAEDFSVRKLPEPTYTIEYYGSFARFGSGLDGFLDQAFKKIGC